MSRLRTQGSANWDWSLVGTLFAINSERGRGQEFSSLEILCSTQGRGLMEVALVNELNSEWTTEEITEIPNKTMEDCAAQIAGFSWEHLAATMNTRQR